MIKFNGNKLLSVLLISYSIIAPYNSFASISNEMQTFFNELSPYGNYSPANMIKSQSGTTYSGGSLFVRTPIQNYQLASMKLPTLKAGCNGIDITGGSFSFINKAQIVKAFKNIAANAQGYIFMLAIKSMSPDIASIMKDMQDMENAINSLNINSCKMAEGLVNAGIDQMAAGSFKNNLIGDETQSSAVSDFNDGVQNFGSSIKNIGTNINSTMNGTSSDPAKTNSNDVAVNSLYIPRNIVWEAFNHLDGLADDTGMPHNFSLDMRLLIMSMIGTTVIYPPGTFNTTDTTSTSTTLIPSDSTSEININNISPTGVSLKDFIGEPDDGSCDISNGLMSCTPQNINLQTKILSCGNDNDLSQMGMDQLNTAIQTSANDNNDHCTSPTLGSYSGGIYSLSAIVKLALQAQVSAIVARTNSIYSSSYTSTANSEIKQMANIVLTNSSFPVYKITNLLGEQQSMNGVSPDINIFAQGIAIKLAYAWIDEALRGVALVISGYQKEADVTEQGQMKEAWKTIQKNIADLKSIFRQENQNTTVSLNAELQQEEILSSMTKQLMRNLPTNVSRSIASFGK